MHKGSFILDQGGRSVRGVGFSFCGLLTRYTLFFPCTHEGCSQRREFQIVLGEKASCLDPVPDQSCIHMRISGHD